MKTKIEKYESGYARTKCANGCGKLVDVLKCSVCTVEDQCTECEREQSSKYCRVCLQVVRSY